MPSAAAVVVVLVVGVALVVGVVFVLIRRRKIVGFVSDSIFDFQTFLLVIRRR